MCCAHNHFCRNAFVIVSVCILITVSVVRKSFTNTHVVGKAPAACNKLCGVQWLSPLAVRNHRFAWLIWRKPHLVGTDYYFWFCHTKQNTIQLPATNCAKRTPNSKKVKLHYRLQCTTSGVGDLRWGADSSLHLHNKNDIVNELRFTNGRKFLLRKCESRKVCCC